MHILGWEVLDHVIKWDILFICDILGGGRFWNANMFFMIYGNTYLLVRVTNNDSDQEYENKLL